MTIGLRFPPVDEQFEALSCGVVDLVTPDELRKKLARSRDSGVPLVIKVGFDPTAPDIHLGHVVVLRKMRQFQEFGHRVVFVVGDFTARIGDPTGRSKTRPPLSVEEIRKNAETYRTQCFKILDPEATEIRFNGEWLDPLRFDDVIRLAARYNVARMLERNDFRERYQSGRTIAVHEFLYPLAQAYDSVALSADVELGGTDQLFNLNVGRDIMPAFDLEPQVVLTTPLLEGLDGKEKMSKSLGNYIGVEDAPAEIFGKVMSIGDDLMWRYYELVVGLSPEAVTDLRAHVERKVLHPKKAKEGLAMRIIADLHGDEAARGAREEFDKVFRQGGAPEQITEIRFQLREGKAFLPHLLHAAGLAPSRTEASRLLGQGAVEIEGQRIAPDAKEISAEAGDSRLIKVGKRRFARVVFE